MKPTAIDPATLKQRLRGYDRPVLEAALAMLATVNPDVPEMLENFAEFWRRTNRPRRPGEKRHDATAN